MGESPFQGEQDIELDLPRYTVGKELRKLAAQRYHLAPHRCRLHLENTCESLRNSATIANHFGRESIDIVFQEVRDSNTLDDMHVRLLLSRVARRTQLYCSIFF